ncbi:unnamed protein product [Oreochromis niloticus]|nr:unnamed protein product [Mustela putorius furo]
MMKSGEVWVQIGITSYSTCWGPSIYTRLSQYQKWISDTITETPLGFVTISSSGTDSDVNFICPTSPPTTIPPLLITTVPPLITTTVPTLLNTTVPTLFNTTVPTSFPVIPTMHSNGENLIYFTSLSVLVVLLHVFMGSGM